MHHISCNGEGGKVSRRESKNADVEEGEGGGGKMRKGVREMGRTGKGGKVGRGVCGKVGNG